MQLASAALLAVLVLAAAPASAAGTQLYVHVLDGVQDMPMSPQAPPESYAVDTQLGLGTTSLGCVPNPAPVGAPFQDYHTFYGYAMAHPVDYQSSLGAALDQPRVEPMRGLTGNVSLDGAAPVLHWYWSTGAAEGAPDAAPVPLANVVVHAALRADDSISVDDEAYNAGTLLAEGTSAPALLAADQSQGVTHSMVGNRHVYEFTVPLAVKAPTIPRDQGYNLRVDTYVVRDQCPTGGYVTPNVLQLHSSPGHRPRLELATVQAPVMAPLVPREENGTWRFDLRTWSAWGPVDVANVSAEVTGPSGATSLAVADPYVLPFHCHCPDFGAYAADSHDSRITWDAAADHAAAGAYVMHLRATNLQGTVVVTQDVPFTLAGSQEAPALPAGLLVLAVAGLAAVLRRPS